MFFDDKSLLLFKMFLNEKASSNERREVIELILYEFISKLYSKGEHSMREGEKCRCSFSHMVELQLNRLINESKKLKKKAFAKAYSGEKYSQLTLKYSVVIEKYGSLLVKQPYVDFASIKASSEIISNPSLCQLFLHVYLHYTYFLLFISTNDPLLLSFHQVRPLLFKSFSQEPPIEPISQSPLSLINSTLQVFIKSYKKLPVLLQSLNESSIEILIHLIILNYHFTKKIKSSFLFKHKPIQTIQTMMMLQNQNNSNPDYTHVISSLLSSFFHQSPRNVKILIKVIDISSIPYDQCKSIVKKIFISQFKPNVMKTFNNIIEVVLELKSTNDILKGFLIEVLLELFNYYSDSDDHHTAFLLFFNKEILKEFSIVIHRDKMRFEYFDNKRPNWNISAKLIEFLRLMIEKYSIVIKKVFPVALCLYHRAFGALFDILIALNANKEMYYNNISMKHQEHRRTLLSYFTLNFDLVPTEVLCDKVIKYFLKPDISTNRNVITVSYDNDEGMLSISALKLKTPVERIEYLGSEDYRNRLLNSIENLLKCYPFSDVNTLSLLLERLLTLNINESEQFVSLSNLLLSKEEEEEISKLIEVINDNCGVYCNKLIEEILKRLDALSIEDISKLKSPVNLLISSLRHFTRMKSEKLIDICLSSFSSLLKSNPKEISLSHSIELLKLINEIDNSAKSLSQENGLHQLISEVKQLLLCISLDKETQNDQEEEDNSQAEQLNRLMKETSATTFTIDLCYSLKKLIVYLSTTKANAIPTLTTIKQLFDIASKHLTDSTQTFHFELSIKLISAIYLFIKKTKDNRTYFLKLLREELLSALVHKKHNQMISEKLFEGLIRLIKKIKKSTCFIANELLQIVFDIFDNHLSTLTPISLSSCLSLLSNVIEYSHQEVYQHYNTIIRTGVNYLSSASSSKEAKRASSLLLLKLLKHLSQEDLEPYSSMIFQSLTSQANESNDNVLSYYLSQCLNYYS